MVSKMQINSNLNKNIDTYLSELENLSSKIADSISIGDFGQVSKMDSQRKSIINFISKDTANLNNERRNRIKLIWVNNNHIINKAEEYMSSKAKNYNKQKKRFKAYSNNN